MRLSELAVQIVTLEMSSARAPVGDRVQTTELLAAVISAIPERFAATFCHKAARGGRNAVCTSVPGARHATGSRGQFNLEELLSRLDRVRLSCLLPLSSKLTEETPVVGPHPLLEEPTLIVKAEDVYQVPDYTLAVRRQVARR
jgi:hypothetical protein